jgi:formylglycine-generating enzyme required for sulfatase activity
MTLLHAKAFLKIGLVAIAPTLLISAPETSNNDDEPAIVGIDTVRLAPGDFSYRVAGEFSRGGMPVNAPFVRLRQALPLVIMKAQVSEAEFDRCVHDAACKPTGQRGAPRPNVPVTTVSWEDATAYAQWLSAKTGDLWRLPSDEEWVFAAGSRAQDDAVEVPTAGFSDRWLARYEKESARERAAGNLPRIAGSFGANEQGLLDMGGNVWEWTDSCYTRQNIDEQDRRIDIPSVNCGVRVVEGSHRTYITNFIRDARGGGCAVGTPPDNLGFRLVRDERPWIGRVVWRAWKWLGRIA